MKQVCGRWVLCTLVGVCALLSNTNAGAQQRSTTASVEQHSQEEQAALAERREAIAESIVAREEAASGRAFDAGFRAEVNRDLAALSLNFLETQMQRGGLGPYFVGDSQADLVYTPVTPCRIIDTRLAGGAIAAGTTRNFLVAASNYSTQGGSATTCGIPFGPATAAVINFVAVSPAGPGDLRATPFGTPMPLAAVINYSNGDPNLALANGPAVKICNPATTSCTSDITLQADNSAVQIVADVQGYFRNYPRTPYYAGSEHSGTLSAGAGAVFDALNVNIGGATRCFASVTGIVSASGTPLSTGNPYVNGTYRPIGTALNNEFGSWCFMSTPASGSSYYDCTIAGVALPTGSATNTYDFGCSFHVTGTFNGTAFCHASVICLP